MPIISVIVPVYKVEKYLHRCVDNILAQTFTDFELILVDDGSPDQCGIICDSYANTDKRIKVIHIANGGVSHARNVGLDHAIGVYVTFVDSDDYCDKYYLQTLIDVAQNRCADIVQSGYWKVDENNIVLREQKRNDFDITLNSEKERVRFLIDHILFYGNGWEIWSSLFKNEYIQKNKIRFCETCENFAEDLGFMLEYLLYCKRAVSIGENHYYYVQHTGSMMDRSKQMVRLNPLNEIGVQFGKRFLKEIKDKEAREMYPLLYHLIMSNQYYKKMKLKGADRKKAVYVKKQIKNIRWHDKWMKRLVKNKVALIEMYGEKEASEKILTARLLSHRNWRLFKFEKFIAFQILRIGEKNAQN